MNLGWIASDIILFLPEEGKTKGGQKGGWWEKIMKRNEESLLITITSQY
jgi:hypothetical protein